MKREWEKTHNEIKHNNNLAVSRSRELYTETVES